MTPSKIPPPEQLNSGPLEIEALWKRLVTALEDYEFSTFVLGFPRSGDYDRDAHEARFRRLKVELGRRLSAQFPGADADFFRPQLRIDVQVNGGIAIRASPLFLGGRYRKHSRSIPASRWIHHACRGRGCPSCSYSGTLCGPSVEEIVSAPVLRHSGGERLFFHGLGREDVDARMLGSGRPFVLECRQPRRRSLPLASIEQEVAAAAGDLMEVFRLRPAVRAAVREVKSVAAPKSYRAWVAAAGPLPADTALRVEALAGAAIDQLSPTRVMHVKGRHKHRLKRIHQSVWLGRLGGHHVWEVCVDSGTYVKELVSGDGSRTRPSLSAVLGVDCHCAALDVLEIHWEPSWERRVRVESRRGSAEPADVRAAAARLPQVAGKR